MKLKTGDTVLITAGKDKGKKGPITKIFSQTNRVLVKGMNTYRRHMKKQSAQNPGGIVQLERPLPVSNVSLICPTCKKPTRVGYQMSGTEKVRICKKCAAPIKGK